MKKYFLLIASALMLLSFSSCTKENKEEDKNKKEPEKSKECKLLEFSVKGKTCDIKGEIYDRDKVVELVYLAEQFTEFNDLTVKMKVSDKATVTPDPATVKDFTTDKVFTITAEDGITKAEWTVKAVEAKMVVSIEKKLDKELSELGIDNFAKFAGNVIAFCATDKFACANLGVYNMDGTKAGQLNVTGLGDNPTIVNLGNDVKGRLVATVGYQNKEDYTVPSTDATNINAMRVFIWKDGWDKAPLQIYQNPAKLALFMNVGGDFDNSMIIMAPGPRNGSHHTWVFENGTLNGEKWAFFKTGYTTEANPVSNTLQGVGAGENVCPIDGTKEGKFLFAHALPVVSAADGWHDRCAGSYVAARVGLDGEDKPLKGTLWPDKLVSKEKHAGIWGYGNIEICASVKGFTFNGVDYAAIAHVGWAGAYFTLSDITNSTKDKTEYLLRTQAKAMAAAMPSVGYVYDPTTDTGRIIVLFSIGTEKNAKPFIMQYDITRKKI